MIACEDCWSRGVDHCSCLLMTVFFNVYSEWAFDREETTHLLTPIIGAIAIQIGIVCFNHPVEWHCNEDQDQLPINRSSGPLLITCWKQAWNLCDFRLALLVSNTFSFTRFHLRSCLSMSSLRRHIFVCFMTKSAFFVFFFGPSSVKRGRIHIVLGWNM